MNTPQRLERRSEKDWKDLWIERHCRERNPVVLPESSGDVLRNLQISSLQKEVAELRTTIEMLAGMIDPCELAAKKRLQTAAPSTDEMLAMVADNYTPADFSGEPTPDKW